MQDFLNKFKEIVITNCSNKSFEYREWFVKDHLLIVEKIAMEICDLYPNANRNAVEALVWLHDFGKPIDAKNEFETTKSQGISTMREIGFDEEFIQKVLELWLLMEQKNTIDISEQPIEVQIISTADGASHFVGKFYSSYFRDDPKETLEEIEARLNAKIEKDWNKKIVIPEVKKAFESRYLRAKEIVGEYPEKFLS